MRLSFAKMNKFAILMLLAVPLMILICQTAAAIGDGNDINATALENSRATGAMSPVAAFEGGMRYKAGTYDVIVLNGTYKEMGRQYGALMKDELKSVYGIITNSTKKRGHTIEEFRELGHKACEYQPERMKAIYAGMAETSGLTKEDAEALYYGAVFYLILPNVSKTQCSFLAAWGNYTTDGSLILSRNWDLPDLFSIFDPYYVLVIYNPDDGSNSVATFGPAGIRPETLLNSAGLFIADNNDGGSGGSLVFDDRLELISQFFRFMLDCSTIEQLNAGIMSTRPDSPWIVNIASPEKAYSYEENVYDLKRREGPGMIAATNHFVDPGWHIEFERDENSVVRYANLQNLSRGEMGHIDPAAMMKIRDVLIQDGGATFLHYEMGGMKYSTDHQVVFHPSTLTLWIKTIEGAWQEVDLKPLFG